jgi:hypothetical protein
MADSKNPPSDLVKDGLEVTASKSSSGDHDPVPREGQTEHLPSFEHEQALALKFDLRILPCLAVMYLFNALDKGNLGNAKVGIATPRAVRDANL